MANAGLVVFVVAGPALTVVNKSILDAGFEHPVLVSSFGMAATVVFTQLLHLSGRLPLRTRPAGFWLRSCLPVGASAMATMAFGNAAYLFLNLSFIQASARTPA